MLSRYVDMDGGSEVPVVTSHTKAVTCLALPTSALTTPLMATTCQDGVLRIWQMPSQPADWHRVFLWTYSLCHSLHLSANLTVTGLSLHREHACFNGRCVRSWGGHLPHHGSVWQASLWLNVNDGRCLGGGAVCVCVCVCVCERVCVRGKPL